MNDTAKPINVALIMVGTDRGPEWDLRLEQSDGKIYPLCTVTSDDATGMGYLFAHAARAMNLELRQEEPVCMGSPYCRDGVHDGECDDGRLGG